MILKFAKLAYRNLSLYRRRSFLTGSIMVVSVAAIIFAAAMGEAFYHQLVNVGIRTTTGHLQVFAKGWDFDIIMPMSGDIPKISNSVPVEELIAQSPFYLCHSKEILYQMLLYDSSDSNYFAIIAGVEPGKIDETLSGLKLIKGNDISEGIVDGILISSNMERFFKPTLNDMMYIIVGGPNGMMDGIKSRYRGVVRSMPLFADRVSFTDISRLQKLLNWRPEQCTSIKVFLTDKDKAEEVAHWLQGQFNTRGLALEIKTWKDLGGFYYHIALLGRVLVFFLLLIFAAITAISVSNTMLMSVKERTREIGTIMALGLPRNGILGLFLLESFSLSLLSSIIGVIVGIGITEWFAKRGIVEGLALVLEGKLYPILDVQPIIISFLWILAVGTAGGLYPAYKAANLDPIEALRYI